MRIPIRCKIFRVAISYPASLATEGLKEKIAILIDQMRTNPSIRMD